jgi:glutathione S-transferase
MKGTNKHKKVFGKFAKHFDDILRLSKLKYFASDTQVYYGDIAVFDCIHACLDLPCFNRDKELKAFPSLKKWFDNMDNIPQIKKYLEERGTILENLWRTMSKKD